MLMSGSIIEFPPNRYFAECCACCFNAIVTSNEPRVKNACRCYGRLTLSSPQSVMMFMSTLPRHAWRHSTAIDVLMIVLDNGIPRFVTSWLTPEEFTALERVR